MWMNARILHKYVCTISGIRIYLMIMILPVVDRHASVETSYECSRALSILGSTLVKQGAPRDVPL